MSLTTAIMSVLSVYGPLDFDDLENRVFAKLLRDYPEYTKEAFWQRYSRRVVQKNLRTLEKKKLIQEVNGVYSATL